MKSIFEQLGIAFCGLITTLFAILAIAKVQTWTGFSLTGVSVNLIPVGAIFAGFLAASGYYFGALYSQNRANKSLLFFMVIIAGLAQILIYWYKYTSLEVDGQFARDLIPFGEFLRLILENTTFTTYYQGTVLHKFENVGWFGYLLAAREFVGFLIGGFAAYTALRSKAICPSCNLYMRKLKKVQHTFIDTDSMDAYLLAWEIEPLTNQNISSLLVSNTMDEGLNKGVLRVTTVLLGCPICKNKILDHVVVIYNGKEWKYVTKLSSAFALYSDDISQSYTPPDGNRKSQGEKNESSN